MKKSLGATILLILAAAGAALAYQTAARERDYREQLARGDQSLRDGQTYGAIEAYSGAVALRPDSMLAHLRRGEAYDQRNELEAAARDFRTAARLAPSATQPLEALADVFYRLGRFSSAADEYEARLQLDDQSDGVMYKLALARYRSGDIPAALTAVDRALLLSPNLPDAYYLKGICLRETGVRDKAVEAFERAVTLSPGMIPAREELADLYRAAGRRASFLEQLQVIAGLDGAHVERQVALGLAQAQAGRGELAVLTLGSALERTPDQPLIYAALGEVWLDMATTRADRPDALNKAIEALERAAPRATASSDLLTLYGRALLQADRTAEAETVLQMAARRFPVAEAAYLHYALAAERQGNLPAARAALISYRALTPDDPNRADHAARIGRWSLRLNQAGVAADWLAEAVAVRPGDIGLVLSLAQAQMLAGRTDAARATLAQALAKEPANPEVVTAARRVGL